MSVVSRPPGKAEGGRRLTFQAMVFISIQFFYTILGKENHELILDTVPDTGGNHLACENGST